MESKRDPKQKPEWCTQVEWERWKEWDKKLQIQHATSPAKYAAAVRATADNYTRDKIRHLQDAISNIRFPIPGDPNSREVLILNGDSPLLLSNTYLLLGTIFATENLEYLHAIFLMCQRYDDFDEESVEKVGYLIEQMEQIDALYLHANSAKSINIGDKAADVIAKSREEHKSDKVEPRSKFSALVPSFKSILQNLLQDAIPKTFTAAYDLQLLKRSKELDDYFKEQKAAADDPRREMCGEILRLCYVLEIYKEDMSKALQLLQTDVGADGLSASVATYQAIIDRNTRTIAANNLKIQSADVSAADKEKLRLDNEQLTNANRGAANNISAQQQSLEKAKQGINEKPVIYKQNEADINALLASMLALLDKKDNPKKFEAEYLRLRNQKYSLVLSQIRERGKVGRNGYDGVYRKYAVNLGKFCQFFFADYLDTTIKEVKAQLAALQPKSRGSFIASALKMGAKAINIENQLHKICSKLLTDLDKLKDLFDNQPQKYMSHKQLEKEYIVLCMKARTDLGKLMATKSIAPGEQEKLNKAKTLIDAALDRAGDKRFVMQEAERAKTDPSRKPVVHVQTLLPPQPMQPGERMRAPMAMTIKRRYSESQISDAGSRILQPSSRPSNASNSSGSSNTPKGSKSSTPLSSLTSSGMEKEIRDAIDKTVGSASARGSLFGGTGGLGAAPKSKKPNDKENKNAKSNPKPETGSLRSPVKTK